LCPCPAQSLRRSRTILYDHPDKPLPTWPNGRRRRRRRRRTEEEEGQTKRWRCLQLLSLGGVI